MKKIETTSDNNGNTCTTMILSISSRLPSQIPISEMGDYYTLSRNSWRNDDNNDETNVNMNMNAFQHPVFSRQEKVIIWNDDFIDIKWPISIAPILSSRDRDAGGIKP